MFCTECGKKIDDNLKYCKYCGKLNELYEEDEEDFFRGEIVYEEEEEPSKTGKKKYKGSKSNIWAGYLKSLCYFGWALSTAFGIFMGYAFMERESASRQFAAMLFGGGIGFVLGFIAIAVVMLIITACENIATITDNTALILSKMDENK